ncbi:MAG: hypothetical protein HQ546_02975 [Planctomycetes bacterium]|nr:hypothetical protein [Planctomycetota bacterium]
MLLIAAPLVNLYAPLAADPAVPAGEGRSLAELAVPSIALAAGVAVFSVVLGYVPGRLLGTSGSSGPLVFALLLTPLLLPRYVLYYAWTLVLSPTTPLADGLRSIRQWPSWWV